MNIPRLRWENISQAKYQICLLKFLLLSNGEEKRRARNRFVGVTYSPTDITKHKTIPTCCLVFVYALV